MRDPVETILICFSAFLLLALFCMVAVGMPLRSITSSGCYAAGWPDSRVDIFFNRYCVRRVDQTDIIVPYKERNK